MTTKEIITIHKTNEVHTWLEDMWEKCFRYEMDCERDGKIPEAMWPLREAIEETQKIVLMNAKFDKRKLS